MRFYAFFICFLFFFLINKNKILHIHLAVCWLAEIGLIAGGRTCDIYSTFISPITFSMSSDDGG